MSTLKSVGNKLFKTELESHKIELGLIQDFDKLFETSLSTVQKTEPDYKLIVDNSRKLNSEILKAEDLINEAISIFNKLEKNSKDLGIEIPSEVLGKRGRLNNFLNTTKTVKAELQKLI